MFVKVNDRFLCKSDLLVFKVGVTRDELQQVQHAAIVSPSHGAGRWRPALQGPVVISNNSMVVAMSSSWDTNATPGTIRLTVAPALMSWLAPRREGGHAACSLLG